MTIFICGVPRTGKTTLSKMLKEKVSNSNLIVTEAIRNGFQKIDEIHLKEWGTKTSEQRQTIFPIFVKEFLDWNEKFSSSTTILDCGLIELKQIEKLVDEKDIVICLGFGGRENEEIFSYIRQYEKENDYTKTYANETLTKFWGDLSTTDKDNFNFCKSKNIEYFDTTVNRDKVQMKIVKYITDKICCENKDY